VRTFWLCFAVLAACGPSAGDYVDADINGGGKDGGGGPNEFADAAPAEPCDKMDILFVIDDSGSMQEEQDHLVLSFPGFVSVIDQYMTETGSTLDYRIAVTTTGRDIDYTVTLPGFGSIPFSETGPDGAFLGECGLSRDWLERSDPDVTGVFSCRATVGTGGASYEMPLLMTEWAFDDRMSDGTNDPTFLRDDALLALVILTDEDDCSREDNNFDVTTTDACDSSTPEIVPLDHFLSFLDTLKGDRGRWAVAVTAGLTSCETEWGSAFEATRLKQFVADAGDNAVFTSICDADLSAALAEALDTFESACESFPPIP